MNPRTAGRPFISQHSAGYYTLWSQIQSCLTHTYDNAESQWKGALRGCQSGQIMAAAVLLRERANPTDEDINVGMAGNICRCGTYQRIRRAIHRAAQLKAQGGAK